jgi:hypothetical protein
MMHHGTLHMISLGRTSTTLEVLSIDPFVQSHIRWWKAAASFQKHPSAKNEFLQPNTDPARILTFPLFSDVPA